MFKLPPIIRAHHPSTLNHIKPTFQGEQLKDYYSGIQQKHMATLGYPAKSWLVGYMQNPTTSTFFQRSPKMCQEQSAKVKVHAFHQQLSTTFRPNYEVDPGNPSQKGSQRSSSLLSGMGERPCSLKLPTPLNTDSATMKLILGGETETTP